MTLVNGAKIVALRRAWGWDQARLSALSGVDAATVSRLERKVYDDVMLSRIVAIAHALNVTVDDLLETDESRPEPEVSPALQAMTALLARRPASVQRHAMDILRSFLAALDDPGTE